jgi:hypothetical protein
MYSHADAAIPAQSRQASGRGLSDDTEPALRLSVPYRLGPHMALSAPTTTQNRPTEPR